MGDVDDPPVFEWCSIIVGGISPIVEQLGSLVVGDVGGDEEHSGLGDDGEVWALLCW